MTMFITEIPAVLSDKSVRIFEGPLVYANNYEEAKIKAKKMNKDLVVVGEYIMAEKIMFADELGTL
jgi:hypothetical protein|tara:strand:+ start:66 stop:263 length:198 start_codon:yes stop_codon:yes gene_type:complete